MTSCFFIVLFTGSPDRQSGEITVTGSASKQAYAVADDKNEDVRKDGQPEVMGHLVFQGGTIKNEPG